LESVLIDPDGLQIRPTTFRALIYGQRRIEAGPFVHHNLDRMSDVTQILNAIEAGDPQAAEQLFPLVYEELRGLAAARMARERPDHTLDATALVHEAYLRLIGDQQFENRRHFFAAAAEAMRRILVDNARRRQRPRHGGQAQRVDADLDLLVAPSSPVDLVALDDALARLAQESPARAELVKLRFFAGLTMPAAAKMLGISLATAERYWTFARTWLYAELGEPGAQNKSATG
jgi:RNA polymerase sigma factor (TIGR02999 family)